MNSELSHLISLQDVDVEIKRLTEEVESLPARRDKLERQFAESVKEHLGAKQELEDAQVARRRLEGELEHEQQKHQKFKNDLMKATNEREYTTAVREIDVARKAVSALETEILKLMERIEKLEAQVAAAEPEMESRRVEIDGQLKEWQAVAEANRRRLETLRAERGAKMQALGPAARATYERLSRMRSGDEDSPASLRRHPQGRFDHHLRELRANSLLQGQTGDNLIGRRPFQPLPDDLKQHDSGGHAHVQRIDFSAHRD